MTEQQPQPPGWYAAPPPPSPLPPGVVAAEMGDRLLARIVDGLILLGIFGLALVPVIVNMVSSADPVTGEPSDASIVWFFVWVALFVLATALYEIVLIAVLGQTLGKKALKLQVRHLADGSLPGWGGSFLRWAVPFGANLVTCGSIGGLLVYISPFFDNSGRRQGWHDMVAKTVVIKA